MLEFDPILVQRDPQLMAKVGGKHAVLHGKQVRFDSE
jgi:hypothetical protein